MGEESTRKGERVEEVEGENRHGLWGGGWGGGD